MLTLTDLAIDFTQLELTEERILHIIKAIQAIGRHPTQAAWNSYWQSFSESTHPTYLQRDKIFRYKGHYVSAPVDTELRFFKALKDLIRRKWFTGLDTIAEYGCGVGSNLRQFKEADPGIRTMAFDWSQAAIEIAGRHADLASVFDMRHPVEAFKRADAGHLGVLTSGSMEQLGDDYGNFLDYLIGLEADVYVHIEPVIELYDENSLFDYLAIMYHQKRDYLGRYLTALSGRKEVDIQCISRTGFGNQWNEGYSVITWQLK